MKGVDVAQRVLIVGFPQSFYERAGWRLGRKPCFGMDSAVRTRASDHSSISVMIAHIMRAMRRTLSPRSGSATALLWPLHSNSCLAGACREVTLPTLTPPGGRKADSLDLCADSVSSTSGCRNKMMEVTEERAWTTISRVVDSGHPCHQDGWR